MNTRTFFKLYSLPFIVVAIGFGAYAIFVMLVEKQNGMPINDKKEPQNMQGYYQTPSTESTTTNSPTQSTDFVNSPNPTNLIPSNPSTQTHTAKQGQVVDLLDSTSSVRYTKYRSNIRKSPLKNAPIVAKADIWTRLEILEDDKEWSKVRTKSGKEGYIATSLLSEELYQAQIYRVIGNNLNIRLKPDKHASTIGRLHQNMRVNVLEIENDKWAKIELPNKQYGYVWLEYITKE